MSSGTQNLVPKSPAFAATMPTGNEASSSQGAVRPSSMTIRSTPKPMVLKRRLPGPDSLFHKTQPRRHVSPGGSSAGNPRDASLVQGQFQAERGFELVRPSPLMKPYRTKERHVGGKMKQASVPKFLIAPIPVGRSCVRKPEILDELIREGEERKRLEKMQKQLDLEMGSASSPSSSPSSSSGSSPSSQSSSSSSS